MIKSNKMGIEFVFNSFILPQNFKIIVVVCLLFNFVNSQSPKCTDFDSDEGVDNKTLTEFPQIRVSKLVSQFGSRNVGGLATSKNWTELKDRKINVPSTLEYIRFDCTASYRVQWGFQSYPWITWDTWTSAIRPKYSNESVVYGASIEFHKVQETSLQKKIPICYSSEDPCIQSALVAQSGPPNSVEIKYENGSRYGINSKSNKEQFGTNRNCTLKFGFDTESQKFYCQETDSRAKTSGKIFLRPCQDPVACDSLIAKSNCIATPSFPISKCTIENRCRKETAFAGKFPGIAVCHSEKLPGHSAAILYFSSLSNYNSSVNETSRYTNWNDAIPSEMLQLPSFTNPVYTHQKLALICNASYFYLGSGMYFDIIKLRDPPALHPDANIKDTDIPLEQIEKSDTNKTDDHDEDIYEERIKLSLAKESIKSEEANIVGIATKLPLIRSLEVSDFFFSQAGKFKLTCSAPIWNSTEWARKSVEVNVKDSVLPEFEGGNSTIKQYYAPYKRLECLAYGIPKPELTWTRDGANVPDEISLITGEQNQTLVWSVLVLPKLEYALNGNFTCKATNVAGTTRKSYVIILTNKTSSIAISVLIGLAILISVMIPLILLLCRKVRRQKKMLIGLTQEEIDEFMNGRPEYIPFQCDMSTYAYYLPYDKSYEIPRESLVIDLEKILGSGEYGLVLHGVFKNMNVDDGEAPIVKEVAVKTTKPLTSGKEPFKALLSELKIMTYLGHHANVVNLVGACTGNIAKREVYIATEYCENGSLLAYLRTNRYAVENPLCYADLAEPIRISTLIEETSFTNPVFANAMKGTGKGGEIPDIQYVKMEDLGNIAINPQYENIRSIRKSNLIRWSYNIARGMEFLSSKKVIHGDLAARNVLLTRDLTAKICDFGLSRQLHHYTYYTKTAVSPLPLKWLAIECLQNFQFSVESDVWAYGVTLYEIFSIGEVPYSSVQMNGEEFLRALKNGMRLNKPVYAPLDIFDLMMKCWRHEKKQRPTFLDIVKFMKQMVKNFPDTERSGYDDPYSQRRALSRRSNAENSNLSISTRYSAEVHDPKNSELLLKANSQHKYANLP